MVAATIDLALSVTESDLDALSSMVQPFGVEENCEDPVSKDINHDHEPIMLPIRMEMIADMV